MNILKILIADDEKPARKKLISFLEKEGRDLVLSEAENGIDAAEKILNEKPDLVFLDIQMPGLTGFEVIKQVGLNLMPNVVFVTAYDQYAIDAFDVNAIDYLLKPFDKIRFEKSFNKVLNQIKLKRSTPVEYKKLIDGVDQNKRTLDRILVSIGSKYLFVSVADVHYITAQEKYVELKTATGKYLLRDTMTNLESKLDQKQFFRIHRSHIINIELIAEFQPWSHGDYIIILKTGEKLTLSRRYKDNLFGNFRT